MISIVIPNFNGVCTLHQCLSAATTLDDDNYEVIVVDDGSRDKSVEIIKEYPCQLVQLADNRGASRARNAGARIARGDLLFFTDSDCVLPLNSLKIIRYTMSQLENGTVLGGTYTLEPYDHHFFSRFQSVYIHYSETKHHLSPDYLASHALVIDAKTFNESGGFSENFLPILEDVEFSHRLRRLGNQLHIEPGFKVQHIFNYSLIDSLRNAYNKTRYWVMYSLKQKDILEDSGTASHELKINVVCFYLSVFLLAVFLLTGSPLTLFTTGLVQISNLVINRKLLSKFYDANGSLFTLKAILYYFLVYPIPVGLGIVSGVIQFFTRKKELRDNRKVLD